MLSFLGATIVVLDQHNRVLLNEKSGTWAVAEGNASFRDGISKFTALRLLKDTFGFEIPKTPEYLFRVEYVSKSFVPYKLGSEQVLALNDIYVFQLKEDERLINYLQIPTDTKFRWANYTDILNNADKLSLSTLITLNKIYEKIYKEGETFEKR